MSNISTQNDLIEVIYDTAVDPTFWPLILEGFSKLVDNDQSLLLDDLSKEQGYSNHNDIVFKSTQSRGLHTFTNEYIDREPSSEQAFVNLLTPHFRRAYLLNRHIVSIEQERDFYRQYYDKLVIGVIVIDSEYNVITSNQSALNIIQNNQQLDVINNRLVNHDANSQQMMRSITSKILFAEQPISPKTFKHITINGQSEDDEICIYITGMNQSEVFSENRQDLFILYLTTLDTQFHLSSKQLQQIYKLTPKESEIAKKIAVGLSTKVIAKQSNVKLDTVRSQLKSIFQKTKTRSQNSLVYTLLTSPAAWSICKEPAKVDWTMYIPKKDSHFREGSITLQDGRKLTYAEYGDMDGYPVYLFHSSFGCRYQRYPYHDITAKYNVRLIVPDRPGFGLSDKKNNYTYLNWSDDFTELNNHLNIDDCSIMSFISSSPFALACAYNQPQNLNKIMLFGGFSPIDSFNEILDLAPFYRLTLGLAYHTPSLLYQFIKLHARGLQNEPFNLMNTLTSRFSACDQTLMRQHPKLIVALATAVHEQGKNTIYGLYNEGFRLVRPWGFPLEDITKKIDLYYGEFDTHASIGMQNKFKKLLTNHSVNILENSGTYALFQYWEDALQLAKK